MGSRRNHRRPVATVLAWLLLGIVIGLTACGAGGEAPSGLPSTRASERAVDRPASGEPDTPAPERTTEPVATTRPPTAAVVTPERTRTTRSTTAAETTTRPPTSPAATEPAPARTTRTTVPARTSTPVEQTPTPVTSTSVAATVGASQGLGTLGWLLLIALVAALLVAGLLVARSQRRSAWDTEARALESETRTIATTRLPPVLSTTTTGRRSLVWPPVRADLTDALSRWSALMDRASGEARQNWSLRVASLLQELITAVDAENEALATGRDWSMLRTRVDQAGRALTAILTVQPQPEPPPAGEPGPTAFQT
ncbi:hypothetical protein DMB66_11520 [Actinoplanes sp. ATCC 53533]|uniref:hypothetical protein n=1 Tax=Actinoplanes sp. ATCC 53533 TaxID=1288362 RepID=UPI00100368F4|nr:hypothetical protein [Actinoplanes sp. ATCC 53533]RSM69608.1 hypothetical protein DMB66_11520 [Actinoplanes sp. ATCC 53533]